MVLGASPARSATHRFGGAGRTLAAVERVELHVPCPMVRVVWDRGHDAVSGIVRAWDDGGIVLSVVSDNAPVPGLMWIDAREILRVDDIRSDDPGVRLADLTGERLWAIDRSLAELPVLLATLRHDANLVMVQVAATGSREGKVGRITSVDAQHVQLLEVGSSARWTGGTEVVELDDVVSVQWDDPYLRSLATLLEAESTGWIPPG